MLSERRARRLVSKQLDHATSDSRTQTCNFPTPTEIHGSKGNQSERAQPQLVYAVVALASVLLPFRLHPSLKRASCLSEAALAFECELSHQQTALKTDPMHLIRCNFYTPLLSVGVPKKTYMQLARAIC